MSYLNIIIKEIGESSFYYPYFQAIEESSTMLQWSQEEIDECQDLHIQKEVIFKCQ